MPSQDNESGQPLTSSASQASTDSTKYSKSSWMSTLSPSAQNSLKSLHYLDWYTKPKPRQEWVTVQSECDPDKKMWVSSLSQTPHLRGATPNDLVLDLVYVVLLAKLGRAFRSNLKSAPGWACANFFGMFIPIWFLWGAQVSFLNRWEQKDGVFIVFFLGNIMLTALLGVSAETCGDLENREGCSQFATCFAIGRVWLMAYHMYVLYHNHAKYFLSIAMIISTDVFVVVTWLCLALLPISHDGIIFLCLWWVAVATDLLRLTLPILTTRVQYFRKNMYAPKKFLPMDLTLLVERNELFIIICIGEIVAASMAGTLGSDSSDNGHRLLERTQQTSTHFATLLTGLIVLLAAMCKVIYFDITEHPSPTGTDCSSRHHAMSVSMYRGMGWALLHAVLCAAIVLLGSVLEPMTLHGDLDKLAQIVCCFCVAGIIVITSVFDLLHSGSGVQLRRVRKQQRFYIHVAVAALLIAVPFIAEWEEQQLWFLVLVNAVMGTNVTFTIWSHRPLKHLMEGGGEELVQAVADEEAEMVGEIRQSDIVIGDVEDVE